VIAHKDAFFTTLIDEIVTTLLIQIDFPYGVDVRETCVDYHGFLSERERSVVVYGAVYVKFLINFLLHKTESRNP
jgi:hypothetical protein